MLAKPGVNDSCARIAAILGGDISEIGVGATAHLAKPPPCRPACVSFILKHVSFTKKRCPGALIALAAA